MTLIIVDNVWIKMSKLKEIALIIIIRKKMWRNTWKRVLMMLEDSEWIILPDKLSLSNFSMHTLTSLLK